MKNYRDQRIISRIYIDEDFSGANFSGAELINMTFRICDFRGADFSGLKLEGVTFEDCLFDFIETDNFLHHNIKLIQFDRAGIRVKWVEYMGNYKIKCFTIFSKDISYPIDTDGENLICYKKIHVEKDFSIAYGNAVAKLEIPAYADRMVYKGDKCRASCARVLEIKDKQGNNYDVGCSAFYPCEEEYRVDHMVYASNFDDSLEVCSGGIHFFLTEEEAWEYIG